MTTNLPDLTLVLVVIKSCTKKTSVTQSFFFFGLIMILYSEIKGVYNNFNKKLGHWEFKVEVYAES